MRGVHSCCMMVSNASVRFKLDMMSEQPALVCLQASGPLSWVVKQRGSLDDFRKKLDGADLSHIRIEQIAEPPNASTIVV